MKRMDLMFVLGVIAIFLFGILLFERPGVAGDLDPPPGAIVGGNPVPTMHTLDEIYDKIESIESSFPVDCASCDNAPVARTGQTISYATGDDGNHEKGVAWPVPRFTDNGNGTVTDNLTGLVWLKDADCNGYKTWTNALTWANGLFDGCVSCGGTNNDCNLSDGSSAGEWRLPNVKELHSLMDFSQTSPALPSGHPFTNVQSNYYWSSTTHAASTDYAGRVDMSQGGVGDYRHKTTYSYWMWPVRGGN